MVDNFKQQSIKIVTWTAADRIGQQVFQSIVGLILARLVSPESFGIIALLGIFSALSFVLSDCGFGQSVIRKKTSDHKELSTIFLLNTSIGVFLYFLLFLSAPTIAAFFKQPELVEIIRVVFLSVILNAFYLIPLNILAIRLDAKSITKVNLIATIFSGCIGVVLAFMHYEVWALVWQQVSYHFFKVIFFHSEVKWWPSLHFNKRYLNSHIKFSINLLGIGVLNVIFNNIFTLIIGKFFPIRESGYYYQAYKQSETVNYTFVTILGGSAYNIFSHIQDQTTRLARIMGEFFQKTALVVVPLHLFLIASADNLIVTLIGERWAPAIPYFQLLCAANITAPLYMLNINALNAMGNSQTSFIIEIIKKTMILIGIVAFFKVSSKMIITGYVISNWISFIMTLFTIKKELKRDVITQWKELLPAVGIGAAIGTITWLIGSINFIFHIELAIQSITAFAIYICCIRITNKELYYNVLHKTKHLLKTKLR